MAKAAGITPKIPQTPRKRGRPASIAGEEALNKLHRVAYIHFLLNGVEDANMLAIAREAGVSRQMIHHRFGNKQQFFDAVIRSSENHLENKFNIASMPHATDPWIVFNFLGNEICNVILHPQTIDIFRVLNVAAYKHAEVAATHQKSLDKAYAMFTQLLKMAAKELDVEIDDVEDSPRDFLALIHGLALPVIQGRRARPTAAVQTREINSIVDRFLRGIGFTKPAKAAR